MGLCRQIRPASAVSSSTPPGSPPSAAQVGRSPPRHGGGPVRAAVISALIGPDAVEVRDVPDPVPQPGQVMVDVEFAGVVFPDVLQTRGEYQLRPELPFTPGWEVAGVVRKDAGGFRAGQRVAAMPVIGGFAETVAVDADMVFPLPDDVPFEKGAALPLNYLTMHFALLRRAELKRGETVLVHGAAGGVGTAASQLAAAHGARVIAVVSTPDKGDVARAAGAHEIVSVDGFREFDAGPARPGRWGRRAPLRRASLVCPVMASRRMSEMIVVGVSTGPYRRRRPCDGPSMRRRCGSSRCRCCGLGTSVDGAVGCAFWP